MREAQARQLIVTADDFGLSPWVNEAVERAHSDGILSAASLMVGAESAVDAVSRAKRLERLGIGLHLTLLNGRPVLPPAEIPNLVDQNGRFFNDAVRFGIALYVSEEARRQAKTEIAAQFERFAATGLAMDHVNGHRHFHLHPVVLEIIVELAPSFGSPPVRVPLEPFEASFQASRDRAASRLLASLFYRPQTARLRRRLDAAGLGHNDQVFGLYDSGHMIEERMLSLIEALPDGISEIYSHPATRTWDGPDAPPPHAKPEQELQALVSPAIRTKLKSRGLATFSFRDAVRASRLNGG